LRLIREEEPPPPSARLSGTNGSLTALAAERKQELARRSREVRGELDWIVMKALEKDRSRRYETANGLARDIENYLRDDPVEAGPPSVGYRVRKFARRHKTALLTALCFLLLVLLGAAASTWQAVRATAAEAQARDKERRATAAEAQAREKEQQALAQKQRADDEAAIARAITDFVQKELLGQADISLQAGGERNPNITVRELLDRAAQGIDGKFPGQELTEAAIRFTIGSAYVQLGEYAEAQKHLERSLALRQQKLGASHPDTLASMDQLAGVYHDRGRDDEAKRLYQKALEFRSARLEPDHPEVLHSLARLALVARQQGRSDEAQRLYKQVIESSRLKLGSDHPDTLRFQHGLAGMYANLGQFVEAESLYKQVIQEQLRKLGADHPE
jgi:tetratricopeptide (TPR) repeat protein